MGKGYAEGPAAEEAERRLEELARGGPTMTASVRRAVFGATHGQPDPHFLGWADEVDAEKLFASGKAWGLSVRRVPVS